MQRYFVATENWGYDFLEITGDDVHHIYTVMRMKEGEHLTAVHPQKGPAICVITNVKEDQVQCEVVEWLNENSELPAAITIVQSLGKGDKVEQVVKKGTELGAFAFIPYQADRSVAKWDPKKAEKKTQRLSKIAKEASEQSERIHIPEIYELHSLSDLVSISYKYDHCLFAYEDEARKKSYHLLSEKLKEVKRGDKVLIMFGPEGGFSEQEVECLRENHFTSVRLGPRILRMETAPLYFLSSISYQLEEM
ncbi:16S rRNA (uracil(1498)-N(3))-methyltransferase [Halobacillus mangrovi]|uniref:16S rRNA (uracil(1498)-N(3))-methyltransferase n=1 Tax=Halobacillus mangrovi TaxID=402384 RepID=UPI003D95F38B